MGSRKTLAALAVAVVGCMMLTGAPLGAHVEEPAFVANPVGHVDTLIGTGTGGEIVGEINNFPGASVPFGMVQYSPDTTDTYAGYDYHIERSTGFSMTHALGGLRGVLRHLDAPDHHPDRLGALGDVWEKISALVRCTRRRCASG